MSFLNKKKVQAVAFSPCGGKRVEGGMPERAVRTGGLTSDLMGSPETQGLEEQGRNKGHAISLRGRREQPLIVPSLG